MRLIDPKVWVSHHEDKKHFWRYGLSEIQLTAPVKHPVYKLGLMAGPVRGTNFLLVPLNSYFNNCYTLVTQSL